MSIQDNFIPLDPNSEEEIVAVYKSHNPNTGQYYIGASSDVVARISNHLSRLKNKKHRRDGNSKFQEAFDRDSNFTFSIIPTLTKEEAFKLEKDLIASHLDDPLCINAVNSTGIPPSLSEEARKKISETLKKRFADGAPPHGLGRNVSDETKQKMSKASKKVWENESYREEAIKRINDPESKKRQSLLLTGRTDSEETKHKKSIAKKGIPQSEELIKKRADSLRGRVKPKEELESSKLKLRETIASLSDIDQQKRLKRIAEAGKEGSDKTKIPICFNGKEYSSRSEAIKGEGISPATFYKRLKEQGFEVKK